MDEANRELNMVEGIAVIWLKEKSTRTYDEADGKINESVNMAVI